MSWAYLRFVCICLLALPACGETRNGETLESTSADSQITSVQETTTTLDDEPDSIDTEPPVLPMVWEPNARYFADVDGLEFIDQNLTPIPTAWGLVGTDTVRFAGGYTGSGLNRDTETSPSVLDAKPGYPVTEYRRDCGDGRFAQIFHFVHVDSPILWHVGADFMQFNSYPQQIEGDLWEYLDEDEQYGFRGLERPLRNVGPDNDNLLSREYVRQLASYATPDDDIQYGGFVYTSFTDPAGEIVEILVAAASHIEVNKQPDNGLVSEPLAEDEPIKLDGLIDHPIVEARISCASETWQLLSPVIDQLQGS